MGERKHPRNHATARLCRMANLQKHILLTTRYNRAVATVRGFQHKVLFGKLNFL